MSRIITWLGRLFGRRDKGPIPPGTQLPYDPFLPHERERLEILLDGLKRYPSGYVHMGSWTSSVVTDAGLTKMAEAMANPCGTACCLAGKAGLMPEFHAIGFQWLTPHQRVERLAATDSRFCLRFTEDPADFFGKVADCALFTNVWMVNFIDTTEQAIIALEYILSMDGAADLRRYVDAECSSIVGLTGLLRWSPPKHIMNRIYALRPLRKTFPVDGVYHKRAEFQWQGRGDWDQYPVESCTS